MRWSQSNNYISDSRLKPFLPADKARVCVFVLGCLSNIYLSFVAHFWSSCDKKEYKCESRTSRIVWCGKDGCSRLKSWRNVPVTHNVAKHSETTGLNKVSSQVGWGYESFGNTTSQWLISIGTLHQKVTIVTTLSIQDKNVQWKICSKYTFLKYFLTKLQKESVSTDAWLVIEGRTLQSRIMLCTVCSNWKLQTGQVWKSYLVGKSQWSYMPRNNSVIAIL